MAYKWVDETKLNAALTASADAIREKTGDTAQINFDMENETGFESAIEEIESGRGTDYLQYATKANNLFEGATMPENLAFKLSNATTISQMLYSSRGWKKLDLEVSESLTNMAAFARDADTYTAGWTHEITLHGSTKNVTRFDQAFYQCSTVTILGDMIDFSGATGIEQTFIGTAVSLNLKPNSLKINVPRTFFGNGNVQNNLPLIQLANVLDESVSATFGFLGTYTTNKIKGITGSSTVVDGHHEFIESSEGTMTLDEFITDVKGWTMATA